MSRLPIKNLYKKPYIKVAFPISKEQIQNSVEAFFEFLNLSSEHKDHIQLKISPMHRRGELGFTHRNPEENIYNDSKDFFHYHPIILKQYADFIESNPVIKNFMDKAQPIWDAVYASTHAILSEFEKDYPQTLSKIFDSPQPHIILRFLRYDYVKSSLYLAKPHFDSGSFTLAIAESNSGLRIGSCPDDLELVSHEQNQAIFMISSNVQKIIDNPELKPGWHDVIQLDTSKVDKPFSRWAVVAFLDGHSVESLSRHETHKYFQAENPL